MIQVNFSLQLAGPKDRTVRIFDNETGPRVDIAGIVRVRLAPSPRKISVYIAFKAFGDVWFEDTPTSLRVQEIISADASNRLFVASQGWVLAKASSLMNGGIKMSGPVLIIIIIILI